MNEHDLPKRRSRSMKIDWLRIESRIRDAISDARSGGGSRFEEALQRIDAILEDETGRGSSMSESWANAWLKTRMKEWTS